MKIVNKTRLIASLEESVRDLTIAIQEAKKEKSYASDLQNALIQFAEEIEDLGPSLEVWDALEDYTEENLRKMLDGFNKKVDSL